jgi:hypothetical protein
MGTPVELQFDVASPANPHGFPDRRRARHFGSVIWSLLGEIGRLTTGFGYHPCRFMKSND